jgi:hypothetical protein
MFRFFLASTMAALGMFSTAQYKGWSVMPTAASEHERRKADQIASATRPSWSSGSGSGGFSGK